MTDLLQEIHNIAMLIETVLKVLAVTGIGVGILIAVGYELQTKRRA